MEKVQTRWSWPLCVEMWLVFLCIQSALLVSQELFHSAGLHLPFASSHKRRVVCGHSCRSGRLFVSSKFPGVLLNRWCSWCLFSVVLMHLCWKLHVRFVENYSLAVTLRISLPTEARALRGSLIVQALKLQIKDFRCCLQPCHCLSESVTVGFDEVTYDSNSNAELFNAPWQRWRLHVVQLVSSQSWCQFKCGSMLFPGFIVSTRWALRCNQAATVVFDLSCSH